MPANGRAAGPEFIYKFGVGPARRHIRRRCGRRKPPTGSKLKVPPGTIFISLFRALFASLTSINYNELYTAMQTHVVDALENPLGVLVAARLYEVQKHLSITNHMWAGYWFLANRRAFEALPADIQATVSRIVNESGLQQRGQLSREDGAYLKHLREKELIINDTQPNDFRNVLIEAGYYKEAQTRFGEQPWALLENYTGKLG